MRAKKGIAYTRCENCGQMVHRNRVSVHACIKRRNVAPTNKIVRCDVRERMVYAYRNHTCQKAKAPVELRPCPMCGMGFSDLLSARRHVRQCGNEDRSTGLI